jgi:aryl-alcohol dehydrogenase-like predicted oxidoreductase
MRQTRLGATGPAVSVLGYGGSALSGSYGAVDAAGARAVLELALDLGVTLFDTADVYGNGLSETLIGEAVAPHRADCRIATKVGMVRSADRSVTTVNGRPEHIFASCEASLKRLRVEAIDLYYLHRVDPTVPIEDTFGAMARLVEAGKVRALGISEPSAGTLRRAHAVHPVAALQMEYSLWCRDCEAEMLPLCRELAIGLVAYCPLGRGFLTDTVSGAPAQQDIRAKDPRFGKENMDRNRALLSPLRDIAGRHGLTTGQVALAWLLGKGDDIVPIPGTRNPDHLRENTAAAAARLSEADMAQLDAAFRPGAVSGERGTPEALARLGR